MFVLEYWVSSVYRTEFPEERGVGGGVTGGMNLAVIFIVNCSDMYFFFFRDQLG